MARKAVPINPISGERIKKLIKERGKSSRWLADKIGITEVHLSNIICGKKRLTEDNAKIIVELFPDVRYEWIMGEPYEFETVKEQEAHESVLESLEVFKKFSKEETVLLSKLTALERHFRKYEITSSPELYTLRTDKVNLLNQEFNNIAYPYGPPSFESKIKYTTVDDIFTLKDKTSGVEILKCTGHELLELATIIDEFAEFQIIKFMRRNRTNEN